MANLGILASGSGSNFQAIAESLENNKLHKISCLICDRKNAYAITRAKNLNIKVYYVSYFNRTKEDAENEINKILVNENCNLIALAGFMRIFSPSFVEKWENKIINIHPSLLPKHPGAHGIEDSYNSGDKELGVTIHYVDKGMDTGPIIYQESFQKGDLSLVEVENSIHALEHKIYPQILIKKLNSIL